MLLKKLIGRSASARAKDESGASAVEMALVLPILVLLLAGIMDFGLVFNDLMTMRQGVGSGVRQGIVGQVGNPGSCTIVGAASANAPTRNLMCQTKSLVGLDEQKSRTMVYFPGSKVKGGSMILCHQYPLDSVTSIFDSLLGGVLKAKVEMRIEQDLSTFGTAAETALPGSDWTWCA